jgi:hypothetical protein
MNHECDATGEDIGVHSLLSSLPNSLNCSTAITVLGAAAEALVPAMQKGNETARNLHIALNAINVVLFLWQIPTGIDMVLKVFEFTKWP